MPKKESVHARRLREIEAERRARHAKVDAQANGRDALRRAADPNSPERLNPKATLTKKKRKPKDSWSCYMDYK